MKLSAKSRYALASVIKMATLYDSKATMTVLEIATELNISKIYLERVFSQLKQGNVVSAIKGSQGGYFLTDVPSTLTLYDVLSCVEPALFAKNDATVEEIAPTIENTLEELIYAPLDQAIVSTLQGITLEMLAQNAQKSNADYMYYL
ncbi:Rrf2 family transcriptional regulator [Wohlfahrtiimonas chitiniclastica]|uniref:RrF2 family transcriptional regulator n=1 Tax=Wohlfahrtiimonas chitiniclastica TaxID=400946 RepID=UPI001BCE0398|nr:Rrf2 family transcriptional regulator [Wohlfahrtiimonas chitiniclastica]MBS7834144.1 Rrf2 family transcriptional regulator [Wohlfahrtiimonas chitiniclastica]